MILPLIFLFSLLGRVVSVSLAASPLLVSEKFRKDVLPKLISYAAGTLLGAAFLVMLPKALESKETPGRITPVMLE